MGTRVGVTVEKRKVEKKERWRAESIRNSEFGLDVKAVVYNLIGK
jgi:CRISPR/Cas system CMR-associated protein Cmr3 (group 5 of RAMP superfamily)